MKFCCYFVWIIITRKVILRFKEMSQPKKNRRLCETLKLSKGYQNGQEVCSFEKDKHSKVKSKSKKSTPNTFSMIEFYQSIPSNESNSIFFSYHQLRSNVIDIKHFFRNRLRWGSTLARIWFFRESSTVEKSPLRFK